MFVHLPVQKQLSFSISQLPTFTQPSEPYSFSNSHICPSWSCTEAAISAFKLLPPLDTELSKGREKTESTETSLELRKIAAILRY